jgi:long-chain-fatty-acid---luciferin-component ligase
MSKHAAIVASAIDRAHIELNKYFFDAPGLERLRRELMFESLNFHLAHNPQFQAYARTLSGGAPFGREILDSPDMPLLPSSLFKRPGLSTLSTAPGNIVKQCVSSGTSGSLSTIGRDEQSLMNFMTSITASLPALFELDRTADYCGIVLGPSTNDAGDLWFAYVISCINLLMKTTYCETGQLFDAGQAADALEQRMRRQEPFVLIGPPLRILQVCEIIRAREIGGCSDKSYVISAGGWKSFENKAIAPAQFRSVVMASLGMSNAAQIRDSFNMVELNTVISECEHHRKHIPPWLIVQSRDPKTNVVLPDGEVGILAFMDAGSFSYPCFILSEDFGAVDSGVCQCGRGGGTFHIVRRMSGIEQRGCALKMSAQGPHKSQASARFFTSVYRQPRAALAPAATPSGKA